VAKRQPSKAVGRRSGCPMVSAKSAMVSSSRGLTIAAVGAGAFVSLMRRVPLMKQAQFFSSAPLARAGSLWILSMFRRPRISGSSPLPSRLARSISTAKGCAIAVRSAGSIFGQSISSSRLILNRKAKLRGVISMVRHADWDSAT